MVAGDDSNKVIDKLQVYYGRAIRDNTDSITNMRNAVIAIWKYTKSTDGYPLHNLCPTGSESWCGFQRDLTNRTSEYSHTHPLPRAIAEATSPGFTALSEETLLSSWLNGGTQNQNEASHALIWQRASKETRSGLSTVRLANF